MNTNTLVVWRFIYPGNSQCQRCFTLNNWHWHCKNLSILWLVYKYSYFLMHIITILFTYLLCFYSQWFSKVPELHQLPFSPPYTYIRCSRPNTTDARDAAAACKWAAHLETCFAHVRQIETSHCKYVASSLIGGWESWTFWHVYNKPHNRIDIFSCTPSRFRLSPAPTWTFQIKPHSKGHMKNVPLQKNILHILGDPTFGGQNLLEIWG